MAVVPQATSGHAAQFLGINFPWRARRSEGTGRHSCSEIGTAHCRLALHADADRYAAGVVWDEG